MDYQILNVVWFILVGVLFAVFFALEGFDFGVGILSGFLAKTETKKKQFIKTIGPTWESNQVWLITAGGAMLAAFPGWYATMFGAYYLALVLMIFSLIIRGMAIEYRSKLSVGGSGRKLADFLFFLGNFISALLWGVVMGNSIAGIPINEQMHYTGGFWNLLNPYALVGGATSLLYFAAHGASFLTLKGPKDNQERFEGVGKKLFLATFISGLIFFIYTTQNASLLPHAGWGYVLGGLAVLLPLAIHLLLNRKRYGFAFVFSFLIPVLAVAAVFSSIFPNVMLSSTSEANHLTVNNAASGQVTLKLMFIVTLCALPVVLFYKIWVYRLFRARVTEENLEY